MIYVFGEFELDAQLFELRRNGAPVRLEPKIYDVLSHLVRHRERVVSKDELLTALWPGEFVSESVLPRCITIARKALGDTRDRAAAIATVHGRGYRFIAEVQERSMPVEGGAPAASPERGFVGRGEVLDRLRAALADAEQGRGRVVLLVGEPGIGKTRTAEEIGAEASAAGVRVWAARCHEGEGAPAYWPWVQILRASLRGRDLDLARREAGAARRDLALLVPEIGDASDERAGPVPDEARFQLFDSVTAYLRGAAAGGAAVVLLDDLHWADGPSLLLLRYLVREMRGARLLLVAAYRDVELRRDHPLAAILGELARESHLERIHLRGLGRDDVSRLIEARSDAPVADELVRAVHAMTDGNPFFVGEIVRLLAAEGRLAGLESVGAGAVILPQSVREAVGRRLDGLTASCNRALAAAAVIGREFDLATLQRVVRAPVPGAGAIEPAALLEGLDEAVAARLLAVESPALGRYAFSHALVRQTLYEELSIPQRLHLHDAVVRALEEIHAADLEPVLSEVAHHAFQSAAGGNAARGVAYARRAAARALGQLAYEDAIAHYERALQLLDLDLESSGEAAAEQRFEVTLALADALTLSGSRLRSEECCRRAVAIAHSLRRPELLARAVLVFGQRESGPLPAEEQSALLGEALASLDEGEIILRSRLLSRMAGTSPHQDSMETRRRLSREALELARRSADRTALLDGMAARLWSLLGPDDDDGRLDAADELQRLAESAGAGESILSAREHRARTFLARGDLSSADAETRAYQELAQQRRQPRYLLFAQWYWGARAICDGRFADAEALARDAFVLGRRIQHPAALGVLFWHVYWTLRQWGEVERYEAVFRETLARYAARAGEDDLAAGVDLEEISSRFSFAGPFLPATAAFVHRALGREDEARRLYEGLAAGEFADVPRDEWWMATLTHLAELAAGWRDQPRVAALVRLLGPFRERNASHSLLRTYAGSVAHFLGLLAGAQGRFDDAEADFALAAGRNRAMGARPALCLTRLEHARLLRGRGRKADLRRADGLLREAEALAVELGLRGLQARAAALRA